jgi:putative ribosome biogenesis GTPase RsgA
MTHIHDAGKKVFSWTQKTMSFLVIAGPSGVGKSTSKINLLQSTSIILEIKSSQS